ncbi:MAG: HAD hydrolase-like protein [Bacteroidetes bacterium]|nr:HAD hydrolase-like protein [Bacteroidota bacterium]
MKLKPNLVLFQNGKLVLSRAEKELSMSEYQLACLDLEGTCMVDAGITETCFIKACEETNIALPENKTKSIHGMDAESIIKGLWREELGDDHVAFPHRVKQTFTAFCKNIDAALEKESIKLTPGTKEALEYFKAHNIKVAIISGLHRWAVDIILDKLGWLDSLDNDYLGEENSPIQLSVCREDVEFGRPKPDLIQYAIDMFEIEDPEQVITIGDTTGDLRSARKAQVGLSLAVANGNNSREKLEKIDHHAILESMEDVPALMERAMEQ